MLILINTRPMYRVRTNQLNNYVLKHLITMASLAAAIYYMNHVSPRGNNKGVNNHFEPSRVKKKRNLFHGLYRGGGSGLGFHFERLRTSRDRSSNY
jgi:hypothetical protein